MSFTNKNTTKLQKQEKIVEENPEEQRKNGIQKEEKTTEIKESGKNSKTGEIMVNIGKHSISPPKRAPRLADMGKTPSMEKNGRWGGFFT